MGNHFTPPELNAVGMANVQAEELSFGERSLRRKLRERSRLIVPDTFQPTHTLLTPNGLEHASSLYGHRVGDEPHRPLFFVNSTQPLWMCLAPKTGCTAWAVFVLYVNRNISLLHNPALIYSSAEAIAEVEFFSSYNPLLAAELKTQDRVWIVRNPYVRFLSSYLDWQSRNSERNSSMVTFEAFVSMYTAEHMGGFEGWTYLPSHVRPVSDVCRSAVLGPDVFLRIEQMDLWYDTFMNHYGLDLFEMRHQTEHSSRFYTPNLSSTTTIAAELAKALGQTPWSGRATRTGHERHSSDKLFKYYTPALARKVYDLQRRDFEMFSYPAWDGNPASFAYI